MGPLKVSRVRPRQAGMGAVDVKQTATLASTSAKVGSIIPGVGTAIGFAVGAVAGLLMHKGQKPQRAALS